MLIEQKQSENRIICIHQPDFFPWLGFFDKIVRCDAFVLLDDVQFPKTGGTYCNRVKLLVGGRGQWVTAPVDRSYHGLRAIHEMEFQRGASWRVKVLKTVECNYGKAPFFSETIELIGPLIESNENNLALYNMHAILAISDTLGISREKFRISSSLGHSGSSTDLLLSLTLAMNGSAYLCGSGALNYQDDSLFDAAGIAVIHRDYKHPVYQQLSNWDFVSGLSIIDALMHCGSTGVRAMLHDGVFQGGNFHIMGKNGVGE